MRRSGARHATFGRPESDNGTVLFPPADPQASLPFFTKSGAGAGFTRFELGDNRVVGAAEMESERDPFFEEMAVYGYRVSFSAPVSQDRKVAATLKGKAASEPTGTYPQPARPHRDPAARQSGGRFLHRL